MKTLSLTLFLFISCTICYSQSNKTDSLKREMNRYVKHDSIKINKILDYISSLNEQDLEKEMPLLKDALKISKELRDAKRQILILQNLGLISLIQNEIDESIPYYLDALKLSEATGNKKQEAFTHYRLSEAYRLYGMDSLRLFHVQKSLKVATAIKDSVQQKRSLVYVGSYFDAHKEYDKADAYYNKALQIAKAQKDDHTKYRILDYKSDRLLTQKDYNGAITINKQLLPYYQGIKSLDFEAYLYSVLGNLYTNINKKDSAYLYANKGLLFSKKHSLKKELWDAYRSLYISHYKFGDYKKAYDYKVIYDSLTKKTYNRKGLLKVESARMQIAQEKKDALDKIGELKKETEAKRIRNLQFTAIGFFVLLAVFLFWTNRQKQKANKVLQEQKDKVESTLQKLKSTQAQLIQSEKLASLGELTAGIAHEIQNPLNFVNNFAEMSVGLAQEISVEIDKDAIDKEYVSELMNDLSQNQEKINFHGKRASSIVTGMLEHSRASTGIKELTDINKLADESLRLSYHGLRAKDKSFNSNFELIADPNLPKINVIPQDIGRVLINLINNAFYAVNVGRTSSSEGSLKPLVLVSTEHADNQVIIKVKDNGTGMSEATKAKIFQPFFTTKPTGQGTGLGLSLAYDIITKGHGGTIECESVEGEGTTFIINLPIQ